MDGMDMNYLRKREAQERALADRTGDTTAQRVHRELAERYAAMVGQVPA